MRPAWPLLYLMLAHPMAPRPDPPYAYQGTVLGIQLQAHQLDLLTGVGEALRVVRLRTVAETRILRAGRAATLADILSGDVVRTECHQTPQGLIADRIEQVERGSP